MVRCSHYPQSPHFLDACDQLGLMVWEEPPGWQYIGDANFDAIFLQNVHDMVIRDRNRPSVIVWGTRLNETASYPTLYAEARQLAYELDGTRQTSRSDGHPDHGGLGRGRVRLRRLLRLGRQCHDLAAGSRRPLHDQRGGGRGHRTAALPLDRQRRRPSSCRPSCMPRSTRSRRGTRRTPACSAGASIDYASNHRRRHAIWQNLRLAGRAGHASACPSRARRSIARRSVPQVAPVILPAFYWDFGPNSPATRTWARTRFSPPTANSCTYTSAGELLRWPRRTRADFGNLPYPPGARRPDRRRLRLP